MSSHERAHQDESNNVTYQRCQYAYEYALPLIKGKKVLDVGCGLAYGTAFMADEASLITALDYDEETVNRNKETFNSIENLEFIRGAVPPLDFADSSFDVVTAFQFIEHIHERSQFLSEAMRVLKPGGLLLVTTPNIKKSLAPNPFHIHEYTFEEMGAEFESVNARFELLGLKGNDKVNKYYEENSRFVRAILKWDFLGLHKKLPSSWLTGPYNWITSLMRNKLKEKVTDTVAISTSDFYLDKKALDEAWDIYVLAHKQ